MSLPTTCPLCKVPAIYSEVITNHVYGCTATNRAFFKCNNCSVIYLYPQLSNEEEHEFYSKEFEGFMDKRSSSSAGWNGADEHVKSNQKQFKRRFNYLKNFLPEQGKILEFGCSSGFMLYPLQEQGFKCFGIEPSSYFSNYVKSKGIHIFENIEEIDEQFDVVMHFFVLEHVREPLEFIQSHLKLLKSKGKLIIEIPNAADPLYTIYNIPAFEKFYWSVAHHWYFDEKSINFLLKLIPNIKYEILRDQRYDLSNHMIWARDGKPGGMEKFSKYLSNELDDLYKKTLIENGQCDTLIIKIEKD